jgi:hypothetical protein
MFVWSRDVVDVAMEDKRRKRKVVRGDLERGDAMMVKQS